MKHLTLSLAIILASVDSIAQKKDFTLDEIVTLGKTTLAPENLKQLTWIPETDRFSYIDDNEENHLLLSGNVLNDRTDSLVWLSDLNKDFGDSIALLKKFPQITWNKKNTFWYIHQSRLIEYNLDSLRSIVRNSFATSAGNIDVFPDSFYVAYTKGNNLYVSINGRERQLSSDDEKSILHGQPVHRNEFGINKGTFWSPNGSYLAYYRMDESMVSEYPLLDISSKPAALKSIRYPMAGQKSHQVSLLIYNVKEGLNTQLILDGPEDQYLTCISWSPDEKYIFIGLLNRDQNHLKMNMYEAATGKFVKTLFEEKNPKYVEPENGLLFVENSNTRFIWQSERDGFNHLYMYDTGVGLIKKITEGNWVVTEINGFSNDNKNLFYTSTQKSPLERHLYQVELATGLVKQITNIKGSHTCIISDKNNFILDSYSSIKTPRDINILTSLGIHKRTVLSSDNPLKSYNLGETSIITLNGENNTELYCRTILPSNFDFAKKYPVLIYVYGGPHVQLVQDTWLGGADLFLNYMAQQGFIVFTLDNRGSENRGIAFESATYRQLGEKELIDQMRGISHLRTLSYVDSDRMGIYGWSFGGFMSTSLMLRTGNTFKAAVAGGAVTDWSLYEVMYTERYMDTPAQNPEGYSKSNLSNYIENLKGKLLLIHGTLDDVVVMQHTQNLLKTAIDKKIPIDYFTYPQHGHNVQGKDRIHLFHKVSTYLIDNI